MTEPTVTSEQALQSADDQLPVPSARESDVQVDDDRIVVAEHAPEELGDRRGVGFAFFLAGTTGGLVFVLSQGPWVNVAFGMFCILAGLLSAAHYWTKPPVERRLTIDADGVTDLSNRTEGFDRETIEPDQVGDVITRPVQGDRAAHDEMYRVDIELCTDDGGRRAYPVYDAVEWSEAQELADEIRRVLAD